MFRSGFLSAVFLFFLTGVALAGTPATEVASFPFSGAWRGGVYADGATGRFSHCAAAASYRSGITMSVAVDRDYSWSLAFGSDSWNLTVGQSIPFVAQFDGGPRWALTANPVTRSIVVISMPNNSDVIRAFRGAEALSITANGQSFAFDLTDTSALIPELVACVRSELARAPRATENESASPASAHEVEALRIASNLLLAAHLPNARLLPASETPAALRGHGVVWRSDRAMGAVVVLPADPAGAQGVAAALISSDSSSCKGTFASERSSDLVEGSAVTSLATFCKDSADTIVTRYFVVRAPSGDDVVFSLLAPAGVSSDAHAPLARKPFEAAAVRVSTGG